MCEWAVVLEAHYAEILELLLAGPPPNVKGDMFYYRLQEAELLDRAPVLTARFLTALLSHEDGHAGGSDAESQWIQMHSGRNIGRHVPLVNPATVAGRVVAMRFLTEFVAYVHCASLFFVTDGPPPGS